MSQYRRSLAYEELRISRPRPNKFSASAANLIDHHHSRRRLGRQINSRNWRWADTRHHPREREVVVVMVVVRSGQRFKGPVSFTKGAPGLRRSGRSARRTTGKRYDRLADYRSCRSICQKSFKSATHNPLHLIILALYSVCKFILGEYWGRPAITGSVRWLSACCDRPAWQAMHPSPGLQFALTQVGFRSREKGRTRMRGGPQAVEHRRHHCPSPPNLGWRGLG